MKIMIEIPEEFICDYEADRFKDCFQRFIYDSEMGLMAGNYEREIAEMLIKAFRDAKEVISCTDCKYLQWNMRQDGSLPLGVDEYECRHWCGSCDPTDFCSYGERKEDETNFNAPTIDPVNHGRWIVRKKFLCCSVCANQIDIEEEQGYPNYCSYCGAKMDGNFEKITGISRDLIERKEE